MSIREENKNDKGKEIVAAALSAILAGSPAGVTYTPNNMQTTPNSPYVTTLDGTSGPVEIGDGTQISIPVKEILRNRNNSLDLKNWQSRSSEQLREALRYEIAKMLDVNSDSISFGDNSITINGKTYGTYDKLLGDEGNLGFFPLEDVLEVACSLKELPKSAFLKAMRELYISGMCMEGGEIKTAHKDPEDLTETKYSALLYKLEELYGIDVEDLIDDPEATEKKLGSELKIPVRDIFSMYSSASKFWEVHSNEEIINMLKTKLTNELASIFDIPEGEGQDRISFGEYKNTPYVEVDGTRYTSKYPNTQEEQKANENYRDFPLPDVLSVISAQNPDELNKSKFLDAYREYYTNELGINTEGDITALEKDPGDLQMRDYVTLLYYLEEFGIDPHLAVDYPNAISVEDGITVINTPNRVMVLDRTKTVTAEMHWTPSPDEQNKRPEEKEPDR